MPGSPELVDPMAELRRKLVGYIITVSETRRDYAAVRADFSRQLTIGLLADYDSSYAAFMQASATEINLCLTALGGLPFRDMILTEWHDQHPAPPHPHMWSVKDSDELIGIDQDVMLRQLNG